MQKQRNHGIELYRCLCMFLVIGFHFSDKGLVSVSNISDISFNWCLLAILKCFGAMCNCAFMITSGYLLYDKKYKSEKLLKLWIEVVIYSVIGYCTFVFLTGKQISIKELLLSIFPIMTNKYWYFTSYCLIYLFSPYFNVLIKNTTKIQHRNICILTVFIFSFIYTFFRVKWLSGANSIAIFVTLYFVGSYIRRWDIKIQIKWIYVVFVLAIEFISMISIRLITKDSSLITYFVWDNAKFLPVINCIMMLILFVKMRVNQKIVKIVSFCQNYLFGVYLFHTGDLSSIIFERIFDDSKTYYSRFLVLQILFAMISIFTISIIIDIIRMLVIEKPLLKSIKRINEYLKELDCKLGLN